MSNELIFYKKAANSILPDNLDWFLARCNLDNWEQSQNVVLPNYLIDNENNIQYYGIYNKAFYGEDKIKQLHIPKTISYIGASAFGRSSIKEIYFYSITPRMNLPADVFDNMDLNDFSIFVPPGSKQNYYISSWIEACGGAEMWDMIFQEHDKISIPELRPLYLYGQTGISSITIDENVDKVGLMTLLGTSQLTVNTANEGMFNNTINVQFNNDHNTIFSNQALYRSIPDTFSLEHSLPSITEQLMPTILKSNSLYKNIGLIDENHYLELNTEQIDDFAFQLCNNGEPFNLTITDKVKSISPYAFEGCKIQSVQVSQDADINWYLNEAYIHASSNNTLSNLKTYYKELLDENHVTGYDTPKADGGLCEFIEYAFVENNEGIKTPVLYKEYNGAIDTEEPFFYTDSRFMTIIDSNDKEVTILCDRWRRIETTGDYPEDWESTMKQFMYTDHFVQGYATDEFVIYIIGQNVWLLIAKKTGEMILCTSGVNDTDIISVEALSQYLNNGINGQKPSYIPARMFANLKFDSDTIDVPANIVIGTQAFPDNIKITMGQSNKKEVI